MAREYDAYVFDRQATGTFLPLIWTDLDRVTCDRDGFGIYTVPAHPSQGPGASLSYHEAVNCVAAVVGASLVGVDKRDQHGHDYVRMCEAYFSPAERGGADIFVNSPSLAARTGSMWYFIFPNMLAFFLLHCYPDHGHLDRLLRRVAQRFAEMVPALVTEDWFTGYDFKAGLGTRNGRWTEGDALAGIGWILYMAGERFGNARYTELAVQAISALVAHEDNPFYEVLLPFAVTLAARMNAEIGTDFDVARLLEWCCNGGSLCRPGWGVIVDRWGEYDVGGLAGSRTDGGGYAFAMNTFELAAALAPLPHYAPEFSEVVGRLLLNLANNARLFYPDEIPAEHQTCFDHAGFSRGVIAYEGLRRAGLRPEDRARIPCACGDALGGRWGGGPYSSDLSLYGSSHVGMLAAIVDRTSDPRVLKIDCRATDFFPRDVLQTHLYVNSASSDVSLRLPTCSGAPQEPQDLDRRTPTQLMLDPRSILVPTRGVRLVSLPIPA